MAVVLPIEVQILTLLVTNKDESKQHECGAGLGATATRASWWRWWCSSRCESWRLYLQTLNIEADVDAGQI